MAGTPAQNGNSAAGNNDFSRRAEELAQGMWMTPATFNTREGWTEEQLAARQEEVRQATLAKGKHHSGNGFGLSLGAQAGIWQTPVADDAPDRSKGKINSRGEPKLSGQAIIWGTPRASDAEKGAPNQAFGAGGIPLPAQAAQWPTPRVHMANGTGGGQQGGPDIQTMAETWPTPAARDAKGENSADHLINGTGRLHMDQLPNAVAHGFSLPAHLPPAPGPTLSQLRPIWRRLRASLIASHGQAVWRRLWASRTKARLNPAFVEWLMGWPPGHANCACSATEWSLWQQDMRFALSQLPTASGAWIWQPPISKAEWQQVSMFEEIT